MAAPRRLAGLSRTIKDNGAGALAGFRNKIINGDFSICQRGVTVAVGAGSSGYTLDRWRVATTAGISCSATRNAAAVGFVGGKFYGTFAFTGTGAAGSNIRQRIEDVRTSANKRVTLTFRHGATVAQNVTVLLQQNFGTGGSPSAVVATAGQTVSFPLNLSGRSSLTFDLPDIASKTLGTNGDDCLEVVFILQSANSQTIYLADVSLVEGDATGEPDPFSARHPAQEDMLCKRFFERIISPLSDIFVGSGVIYNATSAFIFIPYAPKRGAVAASLSSLAGVTVLSGGGTLAPTGVSIAVGSAGRGRFDFTVSGGTAGHGAALRLNAGAGGYVDFDSEL